MTQATTIQGPDKQTILSDIIRLIAAHPDSTDAVLPILKAIQITAGASGVQFILFDAPELVVSTGAGDNWSKGKDTLKMFVAKLKDGLHVAPALPNDMVVQSASYWVAPIGLGSQVVGALWISFEVKHDLNADMRPTLQTLVDSLKIVAANIHARDKHESSAQLTTSLLRSITDPLLVLNDDKHLVMMNPAAEKVFNTNIADAFGHSLHEVVKSDELTALADEPGKTLNEWVTDNDRTFAPRLEPVHDTDGKIEGWILALRDLTRFKKLNRNQSEFTRIVSHDLRSPLTAMQGFAEMLEQGLFGSLNEKQAHFVTKILAGITQMTALVDNIQDAGRYDPETGFYELNRSQCDLREIVNRVVENHLVPAEKELKISVSIADNVPIINADANMLERAIINLFDNAIKYTPSGGTIQVDVQCVDNQVRVMVRDSGLGIKEDDQQHLFERHVRIARQEHKRIKGSGLGLFIVRSVAQRHGGDAWVESTEGQGSAFYLGIPLDGQNLIASS